MMLFIDKLLVRDYAVIQLCCDGHLVGYYDVVLGGGHGAQSSKDRMVSKPKIISSFWMPFVDDGRYYLCSLVANEAAARATWTTRYCSTYSVYDASQG